jgi:uncharacterized membrane protein YfcA
VFVFSTVVFGLVWLGIGQAGFFNDAVEDPPEVVVGLSLVTAAVASVWFGYRHARGRGWSHEAATAVALTGLPLGFVCGVVLAYILASAG